MPSTPKPHPDHAPDQDQDALLVSAQWLHSRVQQASARPPGQPRLRILDCSTYMTPQPVGPSKITSGRADYLAQHIPGAQHVDMVQDLSDPNGAYPYTLLSVCAFEALMQRLRPGFPSFDAMAWQRHIDGFGLAPHAFKTLYMMSTGMRRKAVLAVVLASGCPLLLLDEPTAGLDAPSTAWLVETLNTMGRRPNQTALVVLGEWPDALDCTTTTVLTGP